MIAELIWTIELDEIFMGEDAEVLCLRVEIFRRIGAKASYFASIKRSETYRLRPSFPIRPKKTRNNYVDVQILVVDVHFQPDRFEASTAKKSFSLVKARLEQVFGRQLVAPEATAALVAKTLEGRAQ